CFKRQGAQRADMDALEPVRHAIGEEEEISPTYSVLFVPAQVEVGVFATADEKFINPMLRRDLLEHLLRVSDGERNQDGSRPRGNLVDIEVEPFGEKDDFRRNRRDCVIFVLAEEAEVDFGEGVALDYAAVGQNPLAGFCQ